VNVRDLAQVDRPLLERYLADLHTELAGRNVHAERISQLHIFLQAIRRHGWDDSLPANAVFHSEDYPKRGQQLPRALAEHVMAQLENPVNLDQWNDPDRRLITVILIRCGLRLGDTLCLPTDCIVHDVLRDTENHHDRGITVTIPTKSPRTGLPDWRGVAHHRQGAGSAVAGTPQPGSHTQRGWS
jgi:site-specific recombinase XerC